MDLPLELETFKCYNVSLPLYVPQLATVQGWYKQQKKEDAAFPFPFWAKVWPAAIALGTFLAAYPNTINNKKVLELAGGLGLPSLIAAKFARSVTCTDVSKEAMQIVQHSIAYHGYTHMQTAVLDWNRLPKLSADVLLLSDINYEPAAFAQLEKVLKSFIEAGTTIILTTPQRLMAKPFIAKLQPWIQQQEEICVAYGGQTESISLLILQQS